jgi:cation transport protein ChaC
MNTTRRIEIPEPGDVWLFAYGSLMWEPGFAPAEVQPALLYGYHRAFCVRSRIYRGTVDEPGLVLGLDRGGSCRGRGLRIAAADRAAVLAYLAEREMPEDIYSCRRVQLEMAGRRIAGYALVVNRGNGLYAGRLAAADIARIIAVSYGKRGTNRDYLVNTVRHLDQLGIDDGPMHRLLAEVELHKGERK